MRTSECGSPGYHDKTCPESARLAQSPIPMPAASSSRRRRNREPSDDRIEDEDPTQRRGENDEVDDEEEQPRRKSIKEKKASVRKGKVRKEPQGDDDEEEEGKRQEEDDDRIDVNDFKDQPLDRKDAPKIAGIASDWKAIRENVHTSSFQLVTDIAASLAEVEGDSEADKKVSGSRFVL
jgi:E3 SUMO-protein ligase NSE2